MCHRLGNRSMRLCIVPLLAIAATLAACSGSDGENEGDSKDPIVIGMVTAQTGPIGPIDEPPRKMFEMKIDEINQAGGVDGREIQIISRDTESVPENGTQLATDVINEGADFVVVSTDYDWAAPAAIVAQREGKISLSLGAQSAKFGVQGIGDKAFTVGSTDASEGAVHATFADEMGLKDGFLLEDTSVVYNEGYLNGFKKGWEALGGDIVGEAKWVNSDSSIASQITNIKKASPGFIVMPTYPPGGAMAVRQIRAAGIDVPILTSVGMDGSCWSEAAPGVEEVYVTTPVSMYGDDPNEQVNEIFEKYQEEFGELPCIPVAAHSYAIAEALFIGMERADDPTDSDQVKEALEGDPLDLVIGELDFDETTHIGINRPLAVVKHAEPHPELQEVLSPATEISLADSVG